MKTLTGGGRHHRRKHAGENPWPDIVRNFLDRQDWTIQHAANMLGVKHASIRNWLQGDCRPGVEVQKRLHRQHPGYFPTPTDTISS